MSGTVGDDHPGAQALSQPVAGAFVVYRLGRGGDRHHRGRAVDGLDVDGGPPALQHGQELQGSTGVVAVSEHGRAPAVGGEDPSLVTVAEHRADDGGSHRSGAILHGCQIPGRAGVDHHRETARTGRLEPAHDQLIEPSRRTPVDMAEVVALGIGAQHIELLAGEPERPAVELDRQRQVAADRQARRGQVLDGRVHHHPGAAPDDAFAASQPEAVDVGEPRGPDLQHAPAGGLQAVAPGGGGTARHRGETASKLAAAGDRL